MVLVTQRCAQLTACSSGVEGILPPPRTLASTLSSCDCHLFFSCLQTAGQRTEKASGTDFPPQESVTDQAGGKIVETHTGASSFDFQTFENSSKAVGMSLGVSRWEKGELESSNQPEKEHDAWTRILHSSDILSDHLARDTGDNDGSVICGSTP